jgi:hypothetical protein
LETRIKLQLTADIKPESRKKLLDSFLVHQITINKCCEKLSPSLTAPYLVSFATHQQYNIKTPFRTYVAEYFFEFLDTNDQKSTIEVIFEIEKIALLMKDN